MNQTKPRITHCLWSILLSKTNFVVLILIGLMLRLYYCTQYPLLTTDLLRNLGFGKAFSLYGFQLYDLTPFDLSPWPVQYLWPDYHYTYPWVTLLFFSAISAVSTSMVFAKFILLMLDGLNTYLIIRLTHDRWSGLLYWLNPVVLWYGSREGQFESMVVCWMLLAILALNKQKPWAFAFLGLAIQSKLFPVFLVPYFAWRMSWRKPKRLALEFALGLLSFLPTLWVISKSHYLMRLMSPGYVPSSNPLSWLVNESSFYGFYPQWVVLLNLGLSLLFIGLLFKGIRTFEDGLRNFSAVVYLFFIKSNQLGQFWYLILLPAFLMLVEDPKQRRWLLLISAAMGLHVIFAMLGNPIGYVNPPSAMRLIVDCFWGF